VLKLHKHAQTCTTYGNYSPLKIGDNIFLNKLVTGDWFRSAGLRRPASAPSAGTEAKRFSPPISHRVNVARTKDTPTASIGARLPQWLKRPSPAVRYGAAVLLAVLAQVARLPLRPPTLIPHITYIPFILLCAAFSGFGAGLLCTLLCLLETVYFAIEPLGSFRIADPQHWLGFGATALTGLAASALFERLKRSEERQRAAYLELATVQGSAPVMLLVVDETLHVRRANELAVQFAGREVSDLLGLGPGGVIGCLNALADPGVCGHGPACTDCRIRLAVSDTLRNGTPHRGVEAWVPVFADGGEQTRCLQLSTVPMQLNGDGKTALVCAQDITERKLVEVELRQQRDALRRQAELINLSHDAIITADENRVITGWNSGAEEMYGWTEAEAVGHVMHVLLQTSTAPATAGIDEMLRRAGRWWGEIEQSRRDGTRLTVDSRQVLMRDSEGNPSGILEINRDITERKQAREQLLEAHRRTTAILESISDGFNVFDREWRYTYVNPAGASMVHMSREELLGKNIWELWPRLPETPFGAAYRRAVEENVQVQVESYYPEPLNAWFEVRCYPSAEGLTIFFTDVTQRKQAEQELRAQSDALQQQAQLIDLSHDAIIVQDQNRVITGWNKGAQEMYGWTEAEAAGNVTDELLRTSATISTGTINEILGRDGRWDGELEHRRRDGTRLTVDSRQVLLRDPEGNPTGILEINRDITERKAAREQLLEAHRRITDLLESMSDGFNVFDREWRYTYVNAAGARMVGKSPEELLGKNVWELWPYAAATPFGSACRRAVAEDIQIQVETFYPEPLNTWFDLRCYPSPEGLSIFFSDITQRKQAEAEVQRLNAELEQRVQDRTAQLEAANQELETFAYSVSHDLRAPLRGIDGWSMALVEDFAAQLDEEARHYLSRVRSEAQRMGQLIDDLLRLSRVTRAPLERDSVDLTALARSIAGNLREAYADRRIEFAIQPGLTACGDTRLLEVALTNLLSNATKFTGKVAEARIEVGCTEREGRPAFYVRDNGAGFDMAYAGSLFGPFQRLHRASEFPGTGIGLATVQRIVHRHGGRVWADAQVDQGATFYFTVG